MSTIDFGQIADHVRQLEQALKTAEDQTEALWLAGRGAASLVPHQGLAIGDTLDDLYARYEEGLPEAREIQKKLAAIVKNVTAP